MFIYVGKNITATVSGQELKTVACEKCSTEFQYLLTRTAAATATAPYYIGVGAAQRRAEKHARSLLAKRLAREAELVACPGCKWINQKLIEQYRKSRYRGLFVLAMTLLFVGALIDGIIYLIHLDKPNAPLPPELFIIAAIAAGSAVSLLVLQWFLRHRINPNISVNGKPNVPIGTPPAIYKKRDPRTGMETVVTVPSDLSNLQSDAQWATFRAGQLDLEKLCCQCLHPSTTHFRFPIPIDKDTLPAPLCHPCLRKLRNQWWLRNLAAIPISLLVAWFLSTFATAIDDIGRGMIIVFATGFLTLIAVVVNDRLLRPYRLRTADRSRNIYKLRFQNPAYTAILIRKLGQQDGLYQ